MSARILPALHGSWLGGIVDGVVSLVDLMGPLGVGIAIALENLFPPIPSEAVLPIAGLAASRGSFGLVEAIAFATAGSLVGAFALYTIGALVGVPRLRWLFARIPLLDADDIDRTVAWFQRHGRGAVFFGRFVPIFRSLISIPAGVVRMPLWQFALYTGLGSLIWNTVFVMLGWYLGESWHIVERYMDVAQNVVIALVLVAVVVFVVVRVRARRRER
ncbi:DedA family protein [Microbacterium sp. gxy059]|uniref:DedA family protein n=1 Tax=Microbacterium sp. gxy059 TaxID=2957199 RepID=UPI003D978A08